MSKRLLLQNSLSYFIPDKTRDFGCIICGDNINFRRMTEDNFCLFSTVNALTEAFDKGYSLVFLLGDEGTGKSHVLRRFAYDMRNKFDAVVFVQYDDKKYIFSDDCGIYRDDDYTLSNCFYRIFTHDQFYTKDYSQAYFNKPSAKQLFLELRHRNTLLIIDELYVSYYPQYIDFLLENGFKIAVSVRSLPQNTPDNCCIVPLDFPDTVDVCRMIFDDKSSPDAEFVKLCKLFSNRLSALFFAKKFMDFYSYSAKELYNRIISISACENLNPVTDYIKIFYILADFSECEKEVLRSLGVICLHFIDTHDYENDEDILLTTQVAENLTTKSIKKWRRLIDLGFIGLLSDGELYMERHVSDFVLDILKPSSQNCPCLINNITCVFDINLSQLEKDFDALFSTQDLTVLVPNLTENIIDIFTYFISTDAEQYSTIYHVAFAYILNHLGPSTSHRYTNHLMWQNRCYFFHCFVNAMRDENFITSIFTKADNLDEYGEIYTPTIKAYLDILRVATSFIRFSSREHYRQNEYIYYVITDVLDSIIYEVQNSGAKSYDKFCVYSDALRICEETFVFFSNITCNGEFIPDRCRNDSSTGSLDSFCWNDTKAVSVYVLQSSTTFRMFASYQNMTSHFIYLSRTVAVPEVYRYHHASMPRKVGFYIEMSFSYHRLINGFDKFFDFYSKKYSFTNVCKALADVSDEQLELLLSKARGFENSFYDQSPGTSPSIYAKQAIRTITSSEYPLFCATLITCAFFPISEQCRTILANSGIGDMLVHHKKLNNEDLQELYEHCANQLEYSKACVPLLENIMNVIKSNSSIPDACFDRVVYTICYGYIKRVCNHLSPFFSKEYSDFSQKDILKGLDDIECEKLMLEHIGEDITVKSAEHCVAYSFYMLKKNATPLYAQNIIKDAFTTLIYKKLHKDTEISREGFTVLVYLLCDRPDAIKVINEMLRFDLSHTITKEQFKQIKEYILTQKEL